MNIIKELEEVLAQPTFMGNATTGINLAVNQILNKIEDLGFEIVEKEEISKDKSNEFWRGYNSACEDGLGFLRSGIDLDSAFIQFLDRYRSGELKYEVLKLKDETPLTPEDKGRIDKYKDWSEYYTEADCAKACNNDRCKHCPHYSTCQLYESN